MPKVTFIEPSGAQHHADIDSGLSIRDGAVELGIPGIEGDCGGVCSCATCHVYVDEQWLNLLEEPSALETAMLDAAIEPQKNSRLSCQIAMKPELSGLVLRVPARQR